MSGAAAGALAASNPYLAAASGIMSGLAGVGQAAPSTATGGVFNAGDISVGGLNAPPRRAVPGVVPGEVAALDSGTMNIAVMGVLVLALVLVAKK